MTMTKRTLLTALIALLPLFTACDSVDEISSVTNGPSFNASADASAAGVGRRVGGAQPLRQTVSQTGTATVTLSAGMSHTLEVNGYSLWIPQGASKGVTRYTMTLVPITDEAGNTYQLVRLKAYDLHGYPITRFRAGLRLTMPYADADPEQLTDEAKLRIGYVTDGTTNILEIIQVAVNASAQTITGTLTHFSDYTPILD